MHNYTYVPPLQYIAMSAKFAKLSPLCDTYLAVLQLVPPSLSQQWEFHFLGLEIMVLRAGLKRVELHVQRRSKQH